MSDGRGWSVLHFGQESDSSGCASEQLGHDLSGAAFDEVLYDDRAKPNANGRQIGRGVERVAEAGRAALRLVEL